MKSICAIAFAILATLKLAHVVDWSWWIVTSPITGYAGLALVLWALTGALFAYAVKKHGGAAVGYALTQRGK